MSWGRSFQPPDSLTDADIQRMNDVRRDVWTNAMKGYIFGALSGLTGLKMYEKQHNSSNVAKNSLFPKQVRNNAFLAVMLGGTIGAYISVRLAGMKSVRDLYPVFEKAHPKDDKDLDGIITEELAGHNERVLRRRHTLSETLAEDARTHPFHDKK